MFQLLERGARRIERGAEAQRVECRLPGAAARVGARVERGGGRGGREPPRIERIDADLARRELQRGNLELARPVVRLGEHPPRDSPPPPPPPPPRRGAARGLPR